VIAAAALTATLALGLSSQPGTAAHVRAEHATWRYQYLTGGVNTPDGWSHWNPDGTFVSLYVRESRVHGVTPVLTYYQLLQSHGAGDGRPEADKDLANLADATTMKAYYDDFALALQRTRDAAAGRLAILHVEPDLWGYVEQKAAATDDPATVPAAVASTGDPRLSGLPDTAAGFAQALVRLRDRIAPDVRLGYHMSTWGTDVDPSCRTPRSPPSTRSRDAARRSTPTCTRASTSSSPTPPTATTGSTTRSTATAARAAGAPATTAATSAGCAGCTRAPTCRS
jgi:hypothetical protein